MTSTSGLARKDYARACIFHAGEDASRAFRLGMM